MSNIREMVGQGGRDWREPQPAQGCQCDLCRQLRRDTAAAAIVIIGNTGRIFKQAGNQAAPQGKPEANGAERVLENTIFKMQDADLPSFPVTE